MKTPQKFVALLLLAVIFSVYLIQGVFKVLPQFYHAVTLPSLKQQLRETKPVSNKHDWEAWQEKYSTLIQKQTEDPEQIDLMIQASFGDLLTALKALPPGMIQSIEISKNGQGLQCHLVLKK